MRGKSWKCAIFVLFLLPSVDLGAHPQPEALEQRMQRLLDVTREETARREALEILQKMPRAEVEDPYRPVHTGVVQYDEPILVLKFGWESEKTFEDFTTATWMVFRERERFITADLYFYHASWPQTRWLIEMELLDGQGRAIGRASHLLENSGIVLGVPSVGREKISLTFETTSGEAKPCRYRLAFHPFWTRKSNPFQPNREIPAGLVLEGPQTSVLRFAVRTGLCGSPEVQAHIAYENWPAATYALTLKLLDELGKMVVESRETFGNGGFIISRQSLSWTDLNFTLPYSPDWERVVRWELTLERISPRNLLGDSNRPEEADSD